MGTLAAYTGTPGADTFTGTAGDDVFTGSAGDDTLNGGNGNDTAVFSGSNSGYLIETIDGKLRVADAYSVNGDDGSDTLENIEVLRFSNTDLQVSAPATLRHADEFNVTTTTLGDQIKPVISALGDGGFVVAWGQSGGSQLQRFDADGAKQGS